MQLIIPGSATPSTPLGFGCSNLMGGITRRESIALLEAAFDAGIRHFDTAPLYGYGQAESVLGEVLRGKRPQVTIATKFGLRPPSNRTLVDLARRFAQPVIKLAPAIKSRLRRAAQGMTTRARFSPDELRQSIDRSLAALRTDYIDVLLLHEAVASDLTDALYEELQRSVERGKLRAFGIGSERIEGDAIYRAERRFCPVLQFEWSVLSSAKPSYPGAFVITHRSLSENFGRLRAWLANNREIASSWSNELGMDVRSAAVLARLMIAAARHANREGITLFSSRSVTNIKANVELLASDTLLERGARFAVLAARDAAPPLTSSQQTPHLTPSAA